ncbi:MAG: regulatory protein RecX [Bariatricus sp.]
MIITEIEPVTKTKFRLYMDGEYVCMLYKTDLKSFGIEKDSEITDETWRRLKEEVLLKRAKLRAMHLLTDMARTEEQLRQKLRQNGYPEDVAEAAIEYVKSFGYINDENYVRNFIESRKGKKSRREIEALLAQKNVSGELVDKVFEEVYEEHSDQVAIREIMRKKHWNPEEMDHVSVQKAYASLARKGFSYADIKKAFEP